MPIISTTEAGGKNRLAFLDMIAASEIGPALLALSDNGYNVLVGSMPDKPLLFTSYANHPNVYNAKSNSTAAGRYQILHYWWGIYRRQLRLPDFSPLSQDKYALQQLRERGVLALIDAGKFAQAVAKVHDVWASLPGAGYGQHENKLDVLARAYTTAGGTMAA